MSSDSSAADMVLVDTQDGVRTLTLNRPDAANAIAPEQRNRLIALFSEAGARADVRVVVLKSTGKVFCAGADVARIAGSRDVNDAAKPARRPGDVTQTLLDGAQELIAAVLDCRKPVVCAVQGAAAGMGAHLAYACDLVVAADNVSFIESFVLRGLVLDAGGAYLLPRRIGIHRAKELAFFGDKLSAAEALELGLINKVVAAGELDAAVADYSTRLAAAPTAAIALSKRLLNRSLDVDRSTAFLEEAMAQEINSTGADSKEGVAAFVARRPPNFTGA